MSSRSSHWGKPTQTLESREKYVLLQRKQPSLVHCGMAACLTSKYWTVLAACHIGLKFFFKKGPVIISESPLFGQMDKIEHPLYHTLLILMCLAALNYNCSEQQTNSRNNKGKNQEWDKIREINYFVNILH